MSKLYLVLVAALMMVLGPQMSEAQPPHFVVSDVVAHADVAHVASVVAQPAFIDGVTKQRIAASSIATAQGTTETGSTSVVRAMINTEESRAQRSRSIVSCRMRYFKQTVTRNGCRGVITSHICYGNCWSGSYMFSRWGSGNKYEYQLCKCCRTNLRGARKMWFRFTCPNGLVWYYPYNVYNSCSCQTCGRYPNVAGPY